MTLITDAIAAAQALINTYQLLPDLCTIKLISTPTGISGGATVSLSTVASNVPCLYEERIYRDVEAVGQPAAYVTHNIFLMRNATNETLSPEHQIVVAARGTTSELTFNNLIRLDESTSPLVHVGAKLRP